jgi:hypothetical protein
MPYIRAMLLEGLVDAGAGLAVLAGGQKLLDPTSLVRAARSVSLPIGALSVRVLAGFEVAVGLVVLLVGSRLASLALSASYALFTAFVVLALTRGGVLSSCGCFGRADLRPTRSHALLTAAISVAAATGAPGPLPLSVAALVTTAAVTVCAYLVLAVLPLVSTP